MFGSDWQGALGFLRQKLIQLDDYVDQHNLYGDLQHINDKYTPAVMKQHVADALQTADEQVSYWADKAADAEPPAANDPVDPDEIPAPATKQQKGR